ncbi:hypothetical protein H2198_009844 [Neophaeococcomyces mojaviensis]|uniref:Uncharacterized protein n=1 Tax=Neophaeococcomyces mojaviensis TaxID=3383035 RepID=A0ACC2ZTC7_9EURO|nr:hypothetical protein H2198_009844 [Knufia sp. JES_112]
MTLPRSVNRNHGIMDEDHDDLFDGEPDPEITEEQPEKEPEATQQFRPRVAVTEKVIGGNDNGEELFHPLQMASISHISTSNVDDQIDSVNKAHSQMSPLFMRKLTGQASSSTSGMLTLDAIHQPVHDSSMNDSNSGRRQHSAMVDTEESSNNSEIPQLSPLILPQRSKASQMRPVEQFRSSYTTRLPHSPTTSNTKSQTVKNHTPGIYSAYNYPLSRASTPFTQGLMRFEGCNSAVLSGSHDYGNSSPIHAHTLGGTLRTNYFNIASGTIAPLLPPVLTAPSTFTLSPGIIQTPGSLSIDLDPVTTALLADLPDLGITCEMVQDICRAVKFNSSAPSIVQIKFSQAYIPEMNDRLLKMRRAIFAQIPAANPNEARYVIEAIETDLYRRCYDELQAIVPKSLKVPNDNNTKRPAQWHQMNFLIRTLLYIDTTIRNTPQSDLHVWHACCWLEAMQWQFDIHDAWIDAIVNHAKRKGPGNEEAANQARKHQHSTSAQPEAKPGTRRPGRPPGSLNKTTIAKNAEEAQRQVHQFPKPQTSASTDQRLTLSPQQTLPSFDLPLTLPLPRPQVMYQPALNHEFGGNKAYDDGNQGDLNIGKFEVYEPELFSFSLPELSRNPQYERMHAHTPHVQQLSASVTKPAQDDVLNDTHPPRINESFVEYLNNDDLDAW